MNFFWDAERILNTIKDLCIEDNFSKYQNRISNLSVIYVSAEDDSQQIEIFWLPIKHIVDIRQMFVKNTFPDIIKNSYSTNK